MPNTRVTSFECQYDLVNNSATADASLSSSTASSDSNINELLVENQPYAYMFNTEHNYAVLDGTYEEYPSTFSTAYISNDSSDANGEFTTNPQISITFTQPQSCYGITFHFVENYPLEMRITTHSNASVTTTFNPDSLTYIAELDIVDCTRLDIEFTRAMPYRYIKLIGILFGRTLVWGENEIYSGNLVLEKSPIGDLLSINTLDFTVIDKTNEYNLANDRGLHLYFQKRQIANAYEYVNDQKLFLGKYYLDNFSWDERLVSLNCVSTIGLLEDVQYYEGDIYNGTLAGTILDDIFRVAGIDKYTIDTETYNTPVYGTIKPGSCREALQQILFACNSTVDTTGEDGILIYKIYSTIVNRITRNSKISTKITKNDYVYGVQVKYNNYVLNLNSIEEIVKDELYAAGEHTVFFTEAYDNISIKQTDSTTTITPTTVKPYYVTFTLPSDMQITITGNKYEEYELVATATDSYIESGETDTINTYTTTLCNAAMASERAATILQYLKYRLSLSTQTLADDIRLDGRRQVENPNRNYLDFIAWYTSRNFDLTGGFVDTAEMTGIYQYDYMFYYTGNEDLYAGEGVGIL